jgi:hypothetical protein
MKYEISDTRHGTRYPGPGRPSTTVEKALQIRPFYAKQTQFSGLQNDVNIAYTKDYEENRRKLVMKKQTQFKPNQSQFWAKIKGIKANTNPIQSQTKPISNGRPACLYPSCLIKFDICRDKTMTRYHLKIKIFPSSQKSGLFEDFVHFLTVQYDAIHYTQILETSPHF